jgi:catechol 2,3-dioxygenase-like lactoylglutathione lyase family enzyme
VWQPGRMGVDPPTSDSPIEAINAVTLATADMDAALAFYELLGFVAVAGSVGPEFTTLRAGDGFVNLQLDRAHAPVPHIWGRVIFHVADVDALHRRAVEAGLATDTEPADAPWGERYFHMRDPDGHELSFARPLRA